MKKTDFNHIWKMGQTEGYSYFYQFPTTLLNGNMNVMFNSLFYIAAIFIRQRFVHIENGLCVTSAEK